MVNQVGRPAYHDGWRREVGPGSAIRQGGGEGTVGPGEPSKSVGATEGGVGVLPHDACGRCGIAVSQPARGAEDGESRRQQSRKVGITLRKVLWLGGVSK